MSALGSKADMCNATAYVRFTPNSDHKSEFPHKVMSALPPKADMCSALVHVCFSNRPVWVKRFQAIQPLQCRCRLRARASLRTRRKGPSSMGFENEGNNLWVGLTVK